MPPSRSVSPTSHDIPPELRATDTKERQRSDQAPSEHQYYVGQRPRHITLYPKSTMLMYLDGRRRKSELSYGSSTPTPPTVPSSSPRALIIEREMRFSPYRSSCSCCTIRNGSRTWRRRDASGRVGCWVGSAQISGNPPVRLLISCNCEFGLILDVIPCIVMVVQGTDQYTD